MKTRQPIITVVGHIDHGKTTILDAIRGTTVARKEAGAITQHVGASEIPLEIVKKICGPMLEKMNIKFTIPGLLMIDTPGHEAFTNLRKRGGSISDLAILVVDINEGFKAQTREAISILKQFKVPFIVAANKIDLIPGWKPQKTMYFSESIKNQMEHVKQELDNQLYRLVISLADYGIEAERFDRVDDYTKKVAIVPVSGITKEGAKRTMLAPATKVITPSAIAATKKSLARPWYVSFNTAPINKPLPRISVKTLYFSLIAFKPSI